MMNFSEYLFSLFTDEQTEKSLDKVTLKLYDVFEERRQRAFKHFELMDKETFENEKDFKVRYDYLRSLEIKGYTGFDCGFVDLYVTKEVFNSSEFDKLLKSRGITLEGSDWYISQYTNRVELNSKVYEVAEERNKPNLKLLMGLSHSQSMSFKETVFYEVLDVIGKDSTELKDLFKMKSIID